MITPFFTTDHPDGHDKRILRCHLQGVEHACYFRGQATIPQGQRRVLVRLPEYVQRRSFMHGFTAFATPVVEFKQIDGLSPDDEYEISPCQTTTVNMNQFYILGKGNKTYNWLVFCKTALPQAIRERREMGRILSDANNGGTIERELIRSNESNNFCITPHSYIIL